MRSHRYDGGSAYSVNACGDRNYNRDYQFWRVSTVLSMYSLNVTSPNITLVLNVLKNTRVGNFSLPPSLPLSFTFSVLSLLVFFFGSELRGSNLSHSLTLSFQREFEKSRRI